MTTTKGGVDPLADDREQAALAAELAAAEGAGAIAPNLGTLSPGFMRAVHPEHGEPVTFCPGEMLPAWAAAALHAGTGHYDAGSGVFVLGAS